MLCTCCNGFQVFQTYVSNVSFFFRQMLQMFHRDVSKVGRVLHMSQWRRRLANSGLPQGFSSYHAPSSHGAPRRLLSLPSLPFPPSRCGSSSSTENPTRRVRKRQRRWWPRVSRWRRDAHVVASEQAEVCAIRSLRMGNKQPWVSVWTSGR
jgi:hypothetical protein